MYIVQQGERPQNGGQHRANLSLAPLQQIEQLSKLSALARTRCNVPAQVMPFKFRPFMNALITSIPPEA